MIKKLRKNIIVVNMLLVGTVILMICTAVCVNSYLSSKNELERSLEQVIKFDSGNRPPEMLGEPKRASHIDRLNSYITVEIDSDGKIVNTIEVNAAMEDKALDNAVQEVIKENQKSGEIASYSLMYAKDERIDKTIVAFADNSGIYSQLRSTILISTALFAISMLIVFIISLALSGIAVNPVKTAWIKQKEFIADASHELKTPLTVILANNNIVMSHCGSTIDNEMKWLQSTEEEAQHMKKLIDQMLFLAKSDANQDKPELTKTNFSEIAEGTSLNFEPVAFEKNVTIEAYITPDIIINSSPTLLNQLTHILTDNAVKYSKKNGIVFINLKREGEQVIFSVNNKGNVISQEDIKHIFDRFYRGEKSRTTKGYGLGLSIAYDIVKSLGGKIKAESNENSGTTFTVVFCS